MGVGDEETATILASDQPSFDRAKMLIHNIVHEFLTDTDFEVKVTQVLDYGIFAVITAFPLQAVFIPTLELGDSSRGDVKANDVFLARGLGFERLGKPVFSRRRTMEQAGSDFANVPPPASPKEERRPKKGKDKKDK